MRERSAPPLTAPRRLGHPQMALVRAWAEGVDLLQAAQRYLGHDAERDLRRARSELQALLDVLRSVARAQGRPELAALLRRDPEAMVEAGSDRPSLDDFRAQQPEDFYSEAELLALYQAEHGAPDARSGTRRRQRLRARQLEALQWLEGLAVRDPRPEDALASWLDERLARRLAAVGLTRLDQLLAWIRSRGFHWHRTIPRVGAAAAARVLHWLRQHERTLGAMPPWALHPRQQLDARALMLRGMPATVQAAPTGLSGPPLPLERLLQVPLPAALSGRAGKHRAQTAGAGAWAQDDLAAVQAWLHLRTPGSATWRAYRKEAERLLLWALWVARKPVSSLDEADLAAYEAFLAAPPAGWTAPRGTPRWHDDWRPFEGGLSERSAQMALGIVRGMLDAWVAQGYLAVNAWAGKARTGKLRTVPSPASEDGAASVESVGQAAPTGPARSLTPAQQSAMSAWLSHQIARRGATPALLRLNALWSVACTTGLRPAELVAARVGWLRAAHAPAPVDGGSTAGAANTGWHLDVPASATAGAARSLVLDEGAEASLRRYLSLRLAGSTVSAGSVAGDGAVIDALSGTPLFTRLRSSEALSAARLYEVMAQAFADGADALEAAGAEGVAAIRHASTHWLRHGFGLDVVRNGLGTTEVQHRMGHRSRASAAAYRCALQRERRAAGASAASGDAQ